jgi:hypothetical protein
VYRPRRCSGKRYRALLVLKIQNISKSGEECGKTRFWISLDFRFIFQIAILYSRQETTEATNEGQVTENSPQKE